MSKELIVLPSSQKKNLFLEMVAVTGLYTSCQHIFFFFWLCICCYRWLFISLSADIFWKSKLSFLFTSWIESSESRVRVKWISISPSMRKFILQKLTYEAPILESLWRASCYSMIRLFLIFLVFLYSIIVQVTYIE